MALGLGRVMNVPYSSQPARAKHSAPQRGPLELAETSSLSPQTPEPRAGTRFRRGVILGILISVFVFLLLQVLPDYLLKELVLHRAQKHLGQPVNAEHVTLSLIPRIRLSVVNVVSRPVDASADLFRADRIDAMLSVLSWLRGDGAVEQLLFEAPRIVVRRDATGHWSIPLLASKDSTRAVETRDSDAPTLPVMDLQVTKGTISLIDELSREGPKSQELTGVQAMLSVDESSQRANVNVSAFLPSGSQLSTISLIGVLAPLNQGGDSDTGFLNSLHFSGAVQAGGIDLRQVASLFLPPSMARALPDIVHIGADVLVVPRQAGHELVVQKFTMESGAIVLTGSANVAGLGTETTSYALTVASKPLTVQQLLHKVPIEWIPVEWQIRIAEDKPGGTLTLLGATVTSRGTASSQPQWAAEAMLTNGALIVGSGRTPIRDVSARMTLKSDQISVSELHAATDGVQLTEGTAVISDPFDSPTVDLSAAGSADAQSLIRLVSAVWPSAGVSEALSGVDINGNLGLWIHAAGVLKDSGIQLIKGRVEAHDLAFRTSALPLPIHQLSGQVEIVPGRVDIEKLHWQVGAVPVEAWGKIDLGKIARFRDV
ncbi:MAG TPA: AsmA family protein, partial [Nitrospira sp.]|nr:AsmA family protein [Nitrospira sp.]